MRARQDPKRPGKKPAQLLPVRSFSVVFVLNGLASANSGRVNFRCSCATDRGAVRWGN